MKFRFVKNKDKMSKLRRRKEPKQILSCPDQNWTHYGMGVQDDPNQARHCMKYWEEDAKFKKQMKKNPKLKKEAQKLFVAMYGSKKPMFKKKLARGEIGPLVTKALRLIAKFFPLVSHLKSELRAETRTPLVKRLVGSLSATIVARVVMVYNRRGVSVRTVRRCCLKLKKENTNAARVLRVYRKVKVKEEPQVSKKKKIF